MAELVSVAAVVKVCVTDTVLVTPVGKVEMEGEPVPGRLVEVTVPDTTGDLDTERDTVPVMVGVLLTVEEALCVAVRTTLPLTLGVPEPQGVALRVLEAAPVRVCVTDTVEVLEAVEEEVRVGEEEADLLVAALPL